MSQEEKEEEEEMEERASGYSLLAARGRAMAQGKTCPGNVGRKFEMQPISGYRYVGLRNLGKGQRTMINLTVNGSDGVATGQNSSYFQVGILFICKSRFLDRNHIYLQIENPFVFRSRFRFIAC